MIKGIYFVFIFFPRTIIAIYNNIQNWLFRMTPFQFVINRFNGLVDE